MRAICFAVYVLFSCLPMMYCRASAEDIFKPTERVVPLRSDLTRVVIASPTAGSSKEVSMITQVPKSRLNLRAHNVNNLLMEQIGWQRTRINSALFTTYKGRPIKEKAIACSRDGRFLFIGYSSGVLRLWDQDLQKMQTIGAHLDGITSVACTKSGSRLYSTGKDWTVREWDITTLGSEPVDSSGLCEQYCSFKYLCTKGLYRSIACSDDGSTIFVGPDEETGRIKNLSTGEVQPSFEFPSVVEKIVCSDKSGEEARAFAGLASGRCMLWDCTRVGQKVNRQRSYVLIKERGLSGIVLACDAEGRRLFSSVASKKFQSWVEGSPVIHYSGSHKDKITALTCTSKGENVFVGTTLGEIYESSVDRKGNVFAVGEVRDARPGVQLIPGVSERIRAITCNSDASRIFTLSSYALQMRSNYLHDLLSLDPATLQLLHECLMLVKKTGNPCIIDPHDIRWRILFSSCPYLQDHDDLFVMPIEQ